MLGKIKELLDLKEGLDSIRKELESQNKLVGELSAEYKKQISTLQKTNKEQSEDALEMKAELEKFKAEIWDELSEFKALNKGTQKHMLEKFEKELTDQFAIYGKNLEIDKTNYMKIRNELETAGKTLIELNANIKKLAEVSQAIKKEDFELTQHHRLLLAEDKNKRELLMKIDELERLMAAMQRNKREQRPKAPYA